MPKEVERDALKGESLHNVITPDDGDVPGTCPIGGPDNDAHKVGTFNGRLEHKLLARLDRGALADEKFRIALYLRSETLHRPTTLLGT